MRTAPQKRRRNPCNAPDDRRRAAHQASNAAEQATQELRHLSYLLVAVRTVAGDTATLRSSYLWQLGV